MKTNVKKVPVILQMEALECGAASLGMILAYHKKYVPLEQLRLMCNVSRDGSSAKYIALAAANYGMKAKGYRMSVEKLKAETDFPVIIHWEFNHFVVLCGFEKDQAVINDPADGRRKVDLEDFDRSFTGIVLKFQCTDQFEPSGKPKSSIEFLKKRLKGNTSVLTLTFVMGLMVSVLVLIESVFYKIFTDNILIGKMSDWMAPLMLGMGIVLLAAFLAEVIRSVCLAKLQAKISIRSSSNFMWHILRLPVEFFSQRFAGDVAARQQSNNNIAYIMCHNIAPVFLNVVMVVLYLIAMLYYNVWLSLIGIVMACLNILLIFMISEKNTDGIRSIQRDSGKLSGITLASVSMIETIKSGGAEFGFFEKIAGYQAKYNNARMQLRQNNSFYAVVPQIISGLSSGMVLILGVYFIFRGEMTIGSLMAFQSFMSLFLSPVGDLTESVQSFQNVSGEMERVDDVLNYKASVSGKECFHQEESYGKLKGKVEVQDLCFAYSPLAPNLIQDISITAGKGQMIALVGGSGSGKSTIAKIISGLYEPREGQILFDGKKRSEIDRYVFTNSVAVVDQSISLFSGTIRENITMWDETITEDVIIQACKDACIHQEIVSLRDGYDSLIAEGGSNFSGGQRQRLEIARAFVMEPSILILDEATSALDPMTEKLVMDAVKRRNITCFVIAHRLSTIRDADEIIMLEYGNEIERGTHQELLEKDGAYATLIRSE